MINIKQKELICPLVNYSKRDKYVLFKDPLLCRIIKNNLGISGRGLLLSDLKNLKMIDLEGYKIFSLDGIEKCLYLEAIKMRGHYFKETTNFIYIFPFLRRICLLKKQYSQEELNILEPFL
jgi:hypothetical protein